MQHYPRDMRALALGFAGLAGAVDAVGFLRSGGLFVSFMTGNSTRLAVGLAEGATIAVSAAGLIALFLIGVVFNVIVSESVASIHRKVAATLVVSALLILAAVADGLGFGLLVIASLCLAMGAANAIFRRDGDVGIGVTYMTGTLVRLGHRLADRLRGASEAEWSPYLLLWLSLVLGGVAGSVGYLRSATLTLWSIAVFSLILAALTHRLTGRRAAATPIS